MTMTGRRSVMTAVLICSLAIVFAAQVGAPAGWLRVPAGLVFALFAPGYACLGVARRVRLSPTSGLILTVPLSLAVDILVCLILNATPYGVRPKPIVFGLGSATLGLLALGWYLGSHTSGIDRRRSTRLILRFRTSSAKERTSALLLLLALLGLAVWTSVGIVRASRDTAQPFTALYVKSLALAPPHRGWQDGTLTLGVTNSGNHVSRYILWLVTHFRHSSHQVARIWTLTVPSDQSWESAVRVRIGCGGYVKASLFVPPDSAVYRNVFIRWTCTPGQSKLEPSRQAGSNASGKRAGRGV